MQGWVYKLQLAEYDGGEHHPHVVVLEFSGNRDCIVVPCYSRDGFKVQEYITAMRELGHSDPEIFVELDNSVRVRTVGLNTGKFAYWCPSPIRRVSLSVINQAKMIGEMDDTGLLAIVNCMIAAGPLLNLSKSAKKQLAGLAGALKSRLSNK